MVPQWSSINNVATSTESSNSNAALLAMCLHALMRPSKDGCWVLRGTWVGVGHWLSGPAARRNLSLLKIATGGWVWDRRGRDGRWEGRVMGGIDVMDVVMGCYYGHWCARKVDVRAKARGEKPPYDASNF